MITFTALIKKWTGTSLVLRILCGLVITHLMEIL